MKKFDLSKTYAVYSQIGDTIHARLATAEDFQKKGTDHLQEALGRPAVKTRRYTWEVDGQSYVCKSDRRGNRFHGTWKSSDGEKHGGIIPLFNLCLLQMERLPRDRQLLEYPIFSGDDCLIRAMYAAAVWTIAIHRSFHGVGYPKEAMFRAEKAARLGDGWLQLSASQWPPMSF